MNAQLLILAFMVLALTTGTLALIPMLASRRKLRRRIAMLHGQPVAPHRLPTSLAHSFLP